MFGSYLCGNDSVNKCKFLDILKHAHITPFFLKKSYRRYNENYRPVSVVPIISKIFEKLLCKQITLIYGPVFSPSTNVLSDKGSVPKTV